MTEATMTDAARAIYDDCLPMRSIPLDEPPPARWRIKTFREVAHLHPEDAVDRLTANADDWIGRQDYYGIVRVGEVRVAPFDATGDQGYGDSFIATLTVVYTELTVGKDGGE